MTSHSEIDSDEEIWWTIRRPDPDGELKRSELVAAFILLILFALIGVILFFSTAEGKRAF